MSKAQPKPYSYENPLKLKKRNQNSELERANSKDGKTYFHRKLLQLSTRPNINTRNNEEPAQFTFLKLKDQSEDCFALNLVSNPNLKPIEIKIALGIHNIIKRDSPYDTKCVFICTTKNVRHDKLGEDGFVVTSLNGDGTEVYPTALHEALTNLLNIQISNGILNKALKRLDSFHYFNVTPLTPDNFQSGTTNKKIERRAYYKHIEVNQHMCSKNLSNYWLLNREL